MKKLVIVIGIFFLMPYVSWADYSCTATSGTQEDFNTCVTNAASQSGAVTITIPASAPTWSSQSTVSLSSWTNVTSLTIQGAGPTNTVITVGNTDSALSVTAGTKTFVLKDMGFSDARTTNHHSGMVVVSGTAASSTSGWRVTNVYFTDFDDYPGNDTWAMSVYGYGLIDNCHFTAYGSGGGGIRIFGAGNQFANWDAILNFGDANATFVEDCTFTWPVQNSTWPDVAVDTFSSARWVVRHNTITNTFLQVHGLDSTWDGRSGLSFEIYNNTLSSSNRYIGGPYIRGGTGLYHDNTHIYTGNGAGWTGPNLDVYRVCTGTSADIAHWGYCYDTPSRKICSNMNTDGTYTGRIQTCQTDADCTGGATCNRMFLSTDRDSLCTVGDSNCTKYWDGDSTNPQGWPCRDQPGRGTHQDLRPIYTWGNNTNSGTIGAYASDWSCGTVSTYIQEGRDFCNHSPATDCGSVKAWSYTPYTYPHPLRTLALVPPQNLRIL